MNSSPVSHWRTAAATTATRSASESPSSRAGSCAAISAPNLRVTRSRNVAIAPSCRPSCRPSWYHSSVHRLTVSANIDSSSSSSSSMSRSSAHRTPGHFRGATTWSNQPAIAATAYRYPAGGRTCRPDACPANDTVAATRRRAGFWVDWNSSRMIRGAISRSSKSTRHSRSPARRRRPLVITKSAGSLQSAERSSTWRDGTIVPG